MKKNNQKYHANIEGFVMWKLNYKDSNRGVTLIELLVTIAIIGILAGIGVVTVGKTKSTSQQTTCVSNLRGISQGLKMYYNDFMSFPEDGYPDDAKDIYPLSTELADYIMAKSTFICPTDNYPPNINNFASYDPYYVARKGSYDSNELAIGCPRHRGAKNSTSTFTSGSTEITKIIPVLANGQEIPPDGTSAQRKISIVNDTMTFDDGSTITVKNTSGSNYSCFLIQSVRLSDGTLYSIVKVQDNGKIDVQVTSGSKFEVVTPSAIVGVRGTQFTVETNDNYPMAGYRTYVTLTSGAVTVMDRETGKTTLLTDVGTTEVTGDAPLHNHYHAHAGGTWHSHAHPSLNNAHHGKHIPGLESEQEDEDNDGDGYTTFMRDCDDKDSSISPYATEIIGNEIDDDCNSYTDDNGDVTICHKPGTSAEKTMVIDQNELSGHLGHGDFIGSCSGDDDSEL